MSTATAVAPFVVSVTDVEVDGRTESDKIVDKVMGAEGLSRLDQQFGKILKHATELFASGKQTRKYLLLAEECDLYIRKAMDASPNVKRSDMVVRIEERLYENIIGIDDIRVNDWLGVYGLARVVTGQDTVKDMPAEFVGTHAYRTLAILKQAVERDETEYQFKTGWGAFCLRMLNEGVRGKRLDDAVKAHKAATDELNKTNRLKAMTPDRAAQEMAKESAREADRVTADLNKAAEAIRDKSIAANISPEDLLSLLVTRKVIPAVPVTDQLDPIDIAAKMDQDFASKLAAALVQRGDYKVVMVIAATLQGWLRNQNQTINP